MRPSHKPRFDVQASHESRESWLNKQWEYNAALWNSIEMSHMFIRNSYQIFDKIEMYVCPQPSLRNFLRFLATCYLYVLLSTLKCIRALSFRTKNLPYQCCLYRFIYWIPYKISMFIFAFFMFLKLF